MCFAPPLYVNRDHSETLVAAKSAQRVDIAKGSADLLVLLRCKGDTEPLER